MSNTNYERRSSGCTRTYVTLVIYHKTITASEITAALGVRPGDSGKRGERLGPNRIVPKNYWRLGTQNKSKSKDARVHFMILLSRLKGRDAALRKLEKKGCEIVLWCFWESAAGNGGPRLDHQLMEKLSRLPIELRFDVWINEEG